METKAIRPRPTTSPAAALAGLLAAMSSPLQAQQPPPDLASLFELGQLALDTNGDGVPDFVNASLLLGPEPTTAELAAAAEVSGRLGFESTEEEEEGYDTLGGYIFGRLNRIPVVGDQVDVTSGKLRVTHMKGRRIEYLLFVPNGEGPEHDDC